MDQGAPVPLHIGFWAESEDSLPFRWRKSGFGPKLRTSARLILGAASEFGFWAQTPHAAIAFLAKSRILQKRARHRRDFWARPILGDLRVKFPDTKIARKNRDFDPLLATFRARRFLLPLLVPILPPARLPRRLVPFCRYLHV